MTPAHASHVVAVALLLSGPAAAQPNFSHVTSVEVAVLNADRVVVGTIVGIKKEMTGHGITVAIDETLKGRHEKRSDVFAPDQSADALAGWMKRGHRLLVCAGKEQDRLTIREVIDLDANGGRLEVWAADLTTRTTAADVLRTAADTLRRARGVLLVETFRLTVPRDDGYYGFGGRILVLVPADDRLEKRARESLSAKPTWQRKEGVAAVAHFKSDENVALLKERLTDTGFVVAQSAADNRGVEVRTYPVRWAAFSALRSWGVRVDAPVYEEKVSRLDQVRRVEMATVTPAALADLARFENLEWLSLFASDVTDGQIPALARLKNLRELRLDRTTITAAGLKAVAALPGLRALSLGGTAVTDGDLALLAKMPALNVLRLDHTKITDAGLKVVAGFAGLTELDLTGAMVTPAGFKELSKLKTLATIRLDDKQITDALLGVLGEAKLLHVLDGAGARRPVGHPTSADDPRPATDADIVSLRLPGAITDAGLTELKGLTNLRSLRLAWNPKVTDAGVARLTAAFPNCRVWR